MTCGQAPRGTDTVRIILSASLQELAGQQHTYSAPFYCTDNGTVAFFSPDGSLLSNSFLALPDVDFSAGDLEPFARFRVDRGELWDIRECATATLTAS